MSITLAYHGLVVKYLKLLKEQQNDKMPNTYEIFCKAVLLSQELFLFNFY